MKSTSRQAGWSAVATPDASRLAFETWNKGDVPNVVTRDYVRMLVLARDFAVVNNQCRSVIEAISADLRTATNKLVRGDE